MADPLVLYLPEPPSQAGRKGWRSQWRKVRATKAATWAAAIQQATPLRDPPARVRIDLRYRLYSRRDPANLWYDAKPVLDALKASHERQDRLTWRGGLYLDRGYFLDDDLMELGSAKQKIDRANRGLTLIMTTLEAP